eukprot:1036429-Ditylum_brightwellii.AAC.1
MVQLLLPRQAYLPLLPKELSKYNALVKEWKVRKDSHEGNSDMSSLLQKLLVSTCLINSQLHILAKGTEGGRHASMTSKGCHAPNWKASVDRSDYA